MFRLLVEARDRLLAALGTSAPPPKPPDYAPKGVQVLYRVDRASDRQRLGSGRRDVGHATTGAVSGGAIVLSANGLSGRIRNARPAPTNKRQIEPANGRVQLPVKSIRYPNTKGEIMPALQG
jgi:hypothetical protein